MHETAEDLAKIQEIMDRSARTAGPAIRENFADPAWTMSAEEFIDFWGEGRMASVGTVSSSGAVHAAPLEIQLSHGVFHVPTFSNSVRLDDHRANKRCVITSWEDAYRAVIVYGDARLPHVDPAGMVDVMVTPTRIYAIRPPSWHHAAREGGHQ